jgi:hypothetical protein
MKTYYFLLAMSFLASCANSKSTSKGYVYYIDTDFGLENSIIPKSGSAPQKFISYDNYLFEFITSLNTATNVVGNSSVITQSRKVDCVYVMEKNKNRIVQIDTFRINPEIQKTMLFLKKESGIQITNPDSINIEIPNQGKLRDTTINNIKGFVVDTSYLFADTMYMINYSFYSRKLNLLTIFNINKPAKGDTELCYMGIKTLYRNIVIAQFLINNFSSLNDMEIDICKKIIEKIKSSSQKLP